VTNDVTVLFMYSLWSFAKARLHVGLRY